MHQTFEEGDPNDPTTLERSIELGPFDGAIVFRHRLAGEPGLPGHQYPISYNTAGCRFYIPHPLDEEEDPASHTMLLIAILALILKDDTVLQTVEQRIAQIGNMMIESGKALDKMMGKKK